MAENKTTSKLKPTQIKAKTKKTSIPKSIEKPVEPAKTQNINWDVIGFSSAALTLSGAALLFMLGWAYEVNWYGYYGVSMSQVDSLPQNVIIQSIPGIVTILTFLILSTLIALIVIPFSQLAEDAIRFLRNRKVNRKKPKSRKVLINRKPLSIVEWIAILTATEYFLLTLFLAGYKDIVRRIVGINTIYETFYLEFFATTLRTLFPYLLVLLPVVIITVIILRSLKFNLDYQLTLITPQKYFFVSVLIVSIIFTTISITASYAINDAAKGYRGSGGWSIKPILLISPYKIQLQESVRQTCDFSNCISGPFGLIGENDKNFILIKWKEADELYFKYQPGLFIIPKSENTYLVPFSDFSTSLSTPTLQAMPTPTYILSPTITPTIKPTITTTTPTPSQP